MTDYYPNKFEGKCIGDIKQSLKKLISILERYDDKAKLCEINLSDIKYITDDFFEKSLWLLANAEEKERESGLFYDEDPANICTQNIPVKICFDGEYLLVKTPLTIKKIHGKSEKVAKENFVLADFVSAKLKEFSEENPEIKEQITSFFTGKFLTFYVIRYAKKFHQNIHCDNDNLSCSRIQNLICSFAKVSDRVDNMDIRYSFRTCEDEQDIGTLFVLAGDFNTPKAI